MVTMVIVGNKTKVKTTTEKVILFTEILKKKK